MKENIFLMYVKFNTIILWPRETSPAAIKSEPEENNGFYPSPQHKPPKREYEDEDEGYVLSYLVLLTAYSSCFGGVYVFV